MSDKQSNNNLLSILNVSSLKISWHDLYSACRGLCGDVDIINVIGNADDGSMFTVEVSFMVTGIAFFMLFVDGIMVPTAPKA